MPSIVKQVVKTVTKPKSAVERIRSLSLENNYLKILMYGRSGTGKTTIWSSFPGKILALVCSGLKQSGEVRSIDIAENRDKIDVCDLMHSDDIKEIVPIAGRYKTIVLDHSTGLQDMVLKEILGLDELPAQKSWGMASREEYGQCTLKTKEYLRAILNISANVIIISQERDYSKSEEDGGTGNSSGVPMISASHTPSLTGWLCPCCDYICQTFTRRKVKKTPVKVGAKTIIQEVQTDEIEYCLRAGPDPTFTTKFRVPKSMQLPAIIVDPDYDKLKRFFNGEA